MIGARLILSLLPIGQSALELGCDALEDEAVRRGCEGYLKPVFHQGKEIGAIRES